MKQREQALFLLTAFVLAVSAGIGGGLNTFKTPDSMKPAGMQSGAAAEEEEADAAGNVTEERAEEAKETGTKEKMTKAGENEDAAEAKERVEEAKEAAAEENDSLPVLTAAESELLDKLYHYMKWNELSGAAKLLEDKNALILRLLDRTFSGKRYFYCETEEKDGALRLSLEEPEGFCGNGLVLTRADTVFYGSFLDGKPEGKCSAVRTAAPGTKRYVYARGVWKAGRLEGRGSTGCKIFSETGEDGFTAVEKTGAYRANLLDGDFNYVTESGGEISCFRMSADDGVTVLDGRWKRDSAGELYLLAAEGRPERFYALKKADAGSRIWGNLIVWGR